MINFSRIIVITSFIFIFCAIDSLTAQEKAKTSKVDDTPKKEAQEKEKPKQEVKNKPEKRLELILRRQSTTLYPYEQSRFHEFYPWYINRVNNKSKNLYFGFNYSFPKIDSYMDYSFMEIKKANLSMNKTYCNGGYYAYCRETPFSVGDYYRMESDLNFMRYIYSDKISLGGGLRHIQSNLSLVYPNSYNLYMGSKSIGPQISLKFKTSKLVGIYLSGKLNAFYLFGKLLLESSYVDDNYPLGYNYNYIDNRVNSKYSGTEFELALNFSITDSLTFSIGANRIHAKIKPKSKNIVSWDSIDDLDYNVRANNLGNIYYDGLSSSFFQLSLKF